MLFDDGATSLFFSQSSCKANIDVKGKNLCLRPRHLKTCWSQPFIFYHVQHAFSSAGPCSPTIGGLSAAFKLCTLNTRRKGHLRSKVSRVVFACQFARQEPIKRFEEFWLTVACFYFRDHVIIQTYTCSCHLSTSSYGSNSLNSRPFILLVIFLFSLYIIHGHHWKYTNHLERSITLKPIIFVIISIFFLIMHSSYILEPGL